MKNQPLNQYLQQVWENPQQRQQPDLQLLQAAIEQGHVERAKAFIEMKDSLIQLMSSGVNFIPNFLQKKQQVNINGTKSKQSISAVNY